VTLALDRVRSAYERIAEANRPEVFIHLRPEADLVAEAARVDAAVAAGEALPLAGLLVAVKDNVDVAGIPTTAGCPDYAYIPAATAPCVAALERAGALVLGKTNLDQFATGLVGTRSPYGAVRAADDPERVAGGSSSGSAVAVALGFADLGVATDTAGSGRVPAAFAGIVGFKPTRGLVSTEGVVPACASYDCVGVFARSVALAEEAVAVMSAPDGRAWPDDAPRALGGAAVVAVPSALEGLAPGWADAFAGAVERLEEAGVETVEIDVAPFLEAGALLYGSALAAERYAAVGAFIDAHPAAVDPSVAAVIGATRAASAGELVEARARLEELRGTAFAALEGADALLLPTAPERPTLVDVAADPLATNSRLGRFTSFANLFDLAAVAVPAGTVDGAPFGVTLYARAFGDRVVADLARIVRREPPSPARLAGAAGLPLFVIGAHLSGQPLNHQLRGGRLVGARRTAARYRLHALATEPPKPGLLDVGPDGAEVEGELWELPPATLARLLAGLPEPMLLGAVELADGSSVTGFFCHATATAGTPDITRFGGWRAYLARKEAVPA
jgi:allophanate hydrolase